MIQQAIPDILEPIIKLLKFECDAKSVSYDAIKNETKINLCCTGFIRPCSNIKINDVDYSVENVVFGEYITIKGNIALTLPLNITAEPPYFFHGTITATGSEVVRIKKGHDKYPMIYLYEPLTEYYTNLNDIVLYEAELRIFFLDITNLNDWKTDEHYLYAINPMRYLAKMFIEAIKKKRCTFGKIEQYKIVSHARIGTEIAEKGHLKNIFFDNLSGVELIINIPILKKTKCKPCTC